MPLISVIIPAYNVASYIGETLASVFAQTFTDYEVIVINDGSPDTAELERALENVRARIRYLSQQNLGAGPARNAGLRAARGELIAFLDGDDLWLPNYLEEQSKFIRRHECDLVCADAVMFGETGDSAQTYMEWLMNAAPPVGQASFLELISAERCLITSGVVARRQPILEIGLFDESLRTAQDFDLWLRMARSGARLMFHRRPLLRYRVHEHGLTGTTANSITRELRVFDKIEKEYDLAPDETAEVLPVIRGRRAMLQFELGKALIANGDFAAAQTAFADAGREQRTWKTQLALWLSKVAPSAMQNVYARRLAMEKR